ncbi:DUF418 domain-containing protein [Myxococcaceae bacterium GXIMD 01537]
MTSQTLPAPHAGGEARPVDAGERLLLLDALRGFALCGVFVSNVYMWFSGRAFIPPDKLKAFVESASFADSATMYTAGVLVFGRFITIFSFLFGLGFAVQMGRAEERGASIGPLYARRLAILFVIGVSHLFLLWFGDILSTYALLGFGLLLFRKRSDKTLLIWAAVLILAMPLVGMLLLKLPHFLADSKEAAEAVAKAAGERSAARKATALAAAQGGHWPTVVRAFADYYINDFIKPLLTFIFALFGRFLLGLLAGRSRLFHEPERHLPLFRKLFKWALAVGIVTSSVSLVVQQLMVRKIIEPEKLHWLPFALNPVRQLAEVGIAAIYVTGFVLLFQKAAWQRRLGVLAPVGRMALTNYLSQTVASLFIFYGYGFGLIGRVGPAVAVSIALGVYVVQVGVSHLWLSRFRFGPAEWVWRSLTYGKAQPMRLAREAPSVAPA